MTTKNPAPPSTTTAALQPLLTTTDLAAYLGVAPRTVDDWRLRQIGPPYSRLPSGVRYRPEEVDAWLAAREVRPAA